MNTIKEINFTKKEPIDSLIDLNYLNECFLGDSEILLEVISIFLKQTPGKIEILKQGITSKDYTVIRETAHFLKSSFLTMGLKNNTECSEIESLALKNGKIEKITSLFNTLMSVYKTCILEFELIVKRLKKNA